jgi:hypothetical protein
LLHSGAAKDPADYRNEGSIMRIHLGIVNLQKSLMHGKNLTTQRIAAESDLIHLKNPF